MKSGIHDDGLFRTKRGPRFDITTQEGVAAAIKSFDDFAELRDRQVHQWREDLAAWVAQVLPRETIELGHGGWKYSDVGRRLRDIQDRLERMGGDDDVWHAFMIGQLLGEARVLIGSHVPKRVRELDTRLAENRESKIAKEQRRDAYILREYTEICKSNPAISKSGAIDKMQALHVRETRDNGKVVYERCYGRNHLMNLLPSAESVRNGKK